MAGRIDTTAFHQHWLHSHEEDSDDEMVFRPASFDFPPSRGRTGFQLNPDGSMVQTGIAPDDRREQTPGTWKMQDDTKLALYTTSPTQPARVLNIVSADKERLIVKK